MFAPQPNSFLGLKNVLSTTHSGHGDYYNDLDIDADIEGEQETMPDLEATDGDIASKSPDSGGAAERLLLWKQIIASNAEGVTENTHREYIRLADACVKFLLAKQVIYAREEFLSSSPHCNSDEMIAAWIMNDTGLDGKPATGPRGTYTHAQKMRASMTYIFGRIYGLGSQPWKQARSEKGVVYMEGNPSISEKVSSYMVSLRRRKVQAGETTTSARAVSPEIMAKLYDFNHRPKYGEISNDASQPSINGNDIHQWGGPLCRKALQAIYTLAFICMLCVDEVLKIQTNRITFAEGKMILTLPFRKTHQFGEIKPFVLHILSDDEAYLCPVRAVSEWINASKINTGYLFRRMASGDRPVSNNSPMTSEQFLEMFRNNLLDIGVDFAPYGTHSF
ncbi:hypothetical protein JR316_0008006 [Psilocybe cubensis]|uniref:Uncharacterized protein n=2 Tax=Psilocybe cubensis TaxID=181762 RepID=A0ACB8GV21_PSICU|nr:hypothetical protein JR316_0008006 [Psilocybe cubensis]KAH9479416.1 hypothetical protein JR316_0008006 [Psilocybe cubensis]